MSEKRAEWSNQMVFILAATGSAVGLGNIWRFPYVTGENGGGAFVLVYLLCVFGIGLPIMVAELLIGRASRRSPAMAFERLAGKFGKYWKYIGWIGIFAAFFLSSYYSVIGGWTLYYIYKSFTWNMADLTKEHAITSFQQFTSDPNMQIFWTFIFIAIGVIVVLRGIKDGLEAFNKIFIPLLLVMIVLLVINALTCKGAWEGLTFLFYPDFSKITPDVVLSAIGQAFFSLSVGMGAILTYGSYLHQRESLMNTTFVIVLLDSLVAILVGIAIFPVLFSFGMDPEAGPGLTFITLPVAFSNFGNILGPILITVFFMILAFAALTSSISILEPVVAHFVDKELASRKIATIIIGVLIFILSIPSALANGGHDIFSGKNFLGKNWMDFADFIVSDNLLLLGGFAMAMFVFFVVGRDIRRYEVRKFYNIWKTLLIIAAVAVAIIYLSGKRKPYMVYDSNYFINGYYLSSLYNRRY
ncbi:MAG: sodium-dependent transporter [Cyanobacteriota bacterium]